MRITGDTTNIEVALWHQHMVLSFAVRPFATLRLLLTLLPISDDFRRVNALASADEKWYKSPGKRNHSKVKGIVKMQRLLIAYLGLSFGLVSILAERINAQNVKLNIVRIDHLIRQLGSEKFEEREAASKALETIGEPALPALREAQKSSDLEKRRRATALIDKVYAVARARLWRNVERLRGQIRLGERESGESGTVVNLSGTKASDPDLALFGFMSGWCELDLSHTNITDRGLAHFQASTNITWLNLSDTKVSDAGLASLQRLPMLQVIILSRTKVTDVGLIHFRESKQLEGIGLAKTNVTDAGLIYLKHLERLEVLDLAWTKVTDRGLAHLRNLKKLEGLDISDTMVTDSGLEFLWGFQNLQKLWIKGSKVTNQGITIFQTKRPNLLIIKD